MTGDATIIRLRRQRAIQEQLIRYNATNTQAIDRYNELSRAIARMEHPAAVLTLLPGWK